MPTKGNPITVLIYPDGTAEWEAQNKAGTAVSVPPHGDLIDRDSLMQHEVLLPMGGGHLPIVYASYVRNAPTIIPAD